MKRISLALLALLLTNGLFAQEPVITKGVIKQVTVYRSGAFASAEATAKVTKGPNIIEVRGLPLTIDKNSIQVGGKGVFTINSITNGTYFRDTDTLEKKSKAYILGQKIDSLSLLINDLKDNNSVLKSELNLLTQNQNIGSETIGLKLLDIKAAMAYYSPRFLEIKLALLKNEEQYKINDNKRAICQRELNELSKLGDQEVSVTIDLTAESNDPILLTIDFLMSGCGWSPTYDARTDGVNDKLKITYKADVWQRTGIDWNKVDFSLSTGNPSLNNNYTKANRRYYMLKNEYEQVNNVDKSKNQNVDELEVIGTSRTLSPSVTLISGNVTDGKEPIPYATIAVMSKYGKILTGTQTDFDGNFKIHPITPEAEYIEVSYIGCQKLKYYLVTDYLEIQLHKSNMELNCVEVLWERPLISQGFVEEKEAEKPQYSTFNNFTTTEFKINTPYTFLSDGKENQIEINNTEFKAQYEYYAAPELNQSVFLTAKLVDFENSGYENGPLNVFINDGFVATNTLELPKTSDTAIVSLGYDKALILNRERIKNKARTSTLGFDKTEFFAFNITLRNTKNSAVQVQVQEQIPISTKDDVTVNNIKYGNASFDYKTGIVTWNITINAKEKVELLYEYSISYPSKSNITIR